MVQTLGGIMNKGNKFVYVVCGSKEHIDTLHYSLRALTAVSKTEILVLTDSSRNETTINWDKIIDIEAPKHLDHHQASIYLKTGIYQFVEPGYTYCYLDSDQIAINVGVDNVFNQKHSVIAFAPDHCRMSSFSPHAVNCGCLEQNRKDKHELEQLQQKYDHKSLSIKDPELIKKQKELIQTLQVIKHDKWKYFLLAFRFLFSFPTFNLQHRFYYHRFKKFWTDEQGNPILYDNSKGVIALIEKNSHWRWNPIRRRWIGPDGKDVHYLHCNHLREYIETKFAITVEQDNWQHWNGGMFVFDDESKPFLQAWHEKTMAIFTDPAWRTRDQGTLIATAWKFGLQNMETVKKEYNFIADYQNPNLMLADNGNAISDDALVHAYQPNFVHVYHNFGQQGWAIWDWVAAKVEHNNDKLLSH